MEIAISIVEAAKRSGVGRSSIYQAIGRGELKIRKHGRRSLILVDELKEWVSALPIARTSRSGS
jgi:excisionase family DNA binding protein